MGFYQSGIGVLLLLLLDVSRAQFPGLLKNPYGNEAIAQPQQISATGLLQQGTAMWLPLEHSPTLGQQLGLVQQETVTQEGGHQPRPVQQESVWAPVHQARPVHQSQRVQQQPALVQQSGLAHWPRPVQRPLGSVQAPGLAQQPRPVQQPLGSVQAPGLAQQPLGSVPAPGLAHRPRPVQRPLGSVQAPGLAQQPRPVQQPLGSVQAPGLAQQPRPVQQPLGSVQAPGLAQQPRPVQQPLVAVQAPGLAQQPRPVQQPLGSVQAPGLAQQPRPAQQQPGLVQQFGTALGSGPGSVSGALLGSLQGSQSTQSQQQLQGPVKQITWHFPQVPPKPTQPPVRFEMRQPVVAASVAAECGEHMVHVEVKKDLFGIDEPIFSSSLTLGGCAVSGEDSAAQVLIFESELQACSSVLTVTENELIYTFTLHYEPQPLAGTPIVRTGGAVTGIECHYPRLHNVSSNALTPLWIPYASTKTAEELLVFYLRLMTDDWQFERPSNQYFLGDLMNIEASVVQFNHVPLRVFVDSCVATPVPDVNSVPRYSFIENHGCLVDAKLTGSRSHFMPRVQADKLQFQLEVFMFQQQNSSLVYLTCLLKATAASAPTDAEHKACSFTANRWTTADDRDQVCGCCDTTCGSRKGRSAAPDPDLHVEGTVFVGPILIKEN